MEAIINYPKDPYHVLYPVATQNICHNALVQSIVTHIALTTKALSKIYRASVHVCELTCNSSTQANSAITKLAAIISLFFILLNIC